MMTFEELAASRRAWIRDVLMPWCRTARRVDLLKAEQEWNDIAGRVAPERTLWLWAWSRFPCLHTEGLGGLEETWPVRVTLHDGRMFEGYPDNRGSVRGELQVLTKTGEQRAFIDDIASVERG